MKKLTALLLVFSSSTATAQLLTNGNGQLPACAQQCTTLTTAQSNCGSSWSCFCSNVYRTAGGDLTSVCAGSCTNPSDNAAVVTWYTANCGSDNGASEHNDGSGGGGGGTQTASTAASAPSSSTTSTGVESTSSSTSNCGGSWWHCHWQWILMIVIIGIGLLFLGFGGRWLKKRHDRKRDENRHAFNAGITSRSAHIAHDKDNANTSSSSSGNAAPFQPGDNRDSPARTREAFMPYGYAYTRSESRNGENGRESPVTRGGTPFEEMEKGGYGSPAKTKTSAPEEGRTGGGVKEQAKRVLVRQKSAR